MKEVDTLLLGDFRLVVQGYHSLKKAMNNNWKKLLQLSMPKEGHGASSTGILEDTNPNRSILDLGIKSPRVAAPPTNTGPGEVTRLTPFPHARPAP